jgi:putative addiction module component (TIGR02574 family)
MTAVDALFEKAMELGEDERMELANRLLVACEDAPSGWWESVAPEVHRRLAAIDSGQSKTLTYEELQGRLRRRLDALGH